MIKIKQSRFRSDDNVSLPDLGAWNDQEKINQEHYI